MALWRVELFGGLRLSRDGSVHIRFSTQPLEHTDGRDETLFEMLEAAGAPDNLCFASDYPHWDFDDPGFMLKRLPESWRDKVLHGNAAELYGERLGLGRA